MDDKRSGPFIMASELAQYAFCARSWWLDSVQGYPSSHKQEMLNGQSAHLAHGRIVGRHLRLQRVAYALLLLAVLMGMVGIYLLRRGL